MGVARELNTAPTCASETLTPARPLPRSRRLTWLAVTYLVVFLACFLIGEIGFRLFWSPKYWVHTNRLLIGSGQTAAGKKWWPNTTYMVESSEFHLLFRTNDEGYRARPHQAPAAHPRRVAFVGDSFTEGMQVPYESTFCALLEKDVNAANPTRPVVCDNKGVSATDLLEYWHRITHDVLAGEPPDALVLCIYPGNDFRPILPDQAFDAEGRPRREYFHKPTWSHHFIAWVNLHSKFGSYLQRAILSIGYRRSASESQAPKLWWCNPDVAARAHDAPGVTRYRALFRAIDEECRRVGTRLCLLVVGPVPGYAAKDGQSPLARILTSWGLDIPVVDVAIAALARPDRASLTFPIDGHLNELGHAFTAHQAAPRIRAFLGNAPVTTSYP